MWSNLNSRTRRRAAIAILLGAAILILLGSMSWNISNDRLEPRLRQALQRDTEYAVESIGAASFRALPWPSIEVNDLALRKPSSAHERALVSKLKARLNLASWLAGDPQFVDLTLIKPVLHLASSEKLSETEAVSAAVLNFIRKDNRPALRKLRVSEAVVLLDGKDWIRKLNINIANVAASDLRLRANADYRGIPLTLRADIAQGSTSNGRQIAWSIAAPGALATFSGALFGSRSFDAEGFFEAKLSDTALLTRSFGFSQITARLLEGMRLSGNTKVAWPSVQMRNAAIQIGTDQFDGSLETSFEHDPPRFSATLGAESLNALAIAERIKLPSPLNGEWPREQLPLQWLRSGQADLRLSVEKLLLGGVTLEKAALSAHLGDGRLEGILSDARFEKGSVKGRGSVVDSGQGFDARASLNFDQINLGLLQDATAINRLRGLASGALSFETSGATLTRMVQAAQGRGNIAVKNGEMIGIDLDRILSRLVKDNVAVTAGETLNTLPTGGRSRFQSLAANLRMAGGVVTIFESQIRTFGLRAPFEGVIDLNRQMFDLQARLVPATDLSRLGEAVLRVEGPWSKPVLTPEFTPRQNRSEIRQ